MERKIRFRNYEATYSPDDFCNPEYFDSRDKKQRAFVLLNGGFVHTIVFSEYNAFSEQDALDEACDRNRLDGFLVTEAELADYETGKDSEGFPEYDSRITHLGNASEMFDIETFDIWEVPASIFAEDPALMTLGRVADRLNDMADEADREYKAIVVSSPNWQNAYRKCQDLEEALILLKYAGNRTDFKIRDLES